MDSRFRGNDKLPNLDPAIPREHRQELLQISAFQRDAACSRREIFSREVNEHSAAAIRNARPRVVVEFDDQVVEMIVAPEAIRVARRRKFYRAVVILISRVLAPAIVLTDSSKRQFGSRKGQAIRPPPDPQEPEPPARRRAVAFAFVLADAGAAQGDRENAVSGDQMPARRASGGARDPD